MAKHIVYIGRQPPAKDMIGKFVDGLGGVLRSVGVALDGIGASLQGKAGVQEKLIPNTAWMPYKLEEDKPVSGPGYSPAVQALMGTSGNSIQAVVPTKGENVFIAPNAHVIGHVKIGSNSSIWYGAVLRGDVNSIVVGDNTNIQDNVIMHVSRSALTGPRSTVIGNNVNISHGAIIHACTIEDNCLIGMNATILDGCKVEAGSMVAAGALVAPGSVVPSGQIWAGCPAKFLRELTPEESEFITSSAAQYVELAAAHKDENSKSFEEVLVDKMIYEEKIYRGDSDIDVHMGIYRDSQTQGILSVS